MKAIRMHEYGDRSVLRYEDAPKPSADEGQLLIRVEAVGVGYPDVETRRGGNKASRVTKVYRPITFPHVPGLEASGIIEEIGAGVTGWNIGDAVMTRVGGEGAYAEYAAVPAKQALPRPASYTPSEGAAFPTNYLTAYHALHTAGKLQSGETVLINAAAGGFGSSAIQIAKAAGATVIGTTGTSAKMDRLRKLGVDAAIDISQVDLADAAMEANGGRGIDMVLDTVGGDVFLRSLHALRPFGRLVVAGYSSGNQPPPPMSMILNNAIAVAGMNLSKVNDTPAMDASVKHMLELADQGLLKPVLFREMPLSEAPEAHRLIEAREQVGKITLIP